MFIESRISMPFSRLHNNMTQCISDEVLLVILRHAPDCVEYEQEVWTSEGHCVRLDMAKTLHRKKILALMFRSHVYVYLLILIL